MTSVSSPGSLSSPSTNTEVLVKLCVLQVRPSSMLNLPREGAAGDSLRPGPAALSGPALPTPRDQSCRAEAAGRTGRGSDQPQGQSSVPSATGPLPSHSHRTAATCQHQVAPMSAQGHYSQGALGVWPEIPWIAVIQVFETSRSALPSAQAQPRVCRVTCGSLCPQGGVSVLPACHAERSFLD